VPPTVLLPAAPVVFLLFFIVHPNAAEFKAQYAVCTKNSNNKKKINPKIKDTDKGY
jgi:hypothetical protein